MTNYTIPILVLTVLCILCCKSAGYTLIDPGLVGLQKPLPPLQIPNETAPDMTGYTDVDALNGPETDKLLVGATTVLREKTGLRWQPIATQYATKYTDPSTGENIIKSRITFSETTRFFARDYDIASKDGEIVYIQTESKFFDDPAAPKPYSSTVVYHKATPSSVELLKEFNAS